MTAIADEVGELWLTAHHMDDGTVELELAAPARLARGVARLGS